MSIKSPGLGAGGLASLANYLASTFTPTIAGSSTAGVGTYTTQLGRYTRIGNRVYFNIALNWSATTGTGNMRINGLPIASAAAALLTPVNMYIASGITDIPAARIDAATSQIIVNRFVVASGTSALALPAAGEVYVSGCYEI